MFLAKSVIGLFEVWYVEETISCHIQVFSQSICATIKENKLWLSWLIFTLILKYHVSSSSFNLEKLNRYKFRYQYPKSWEQKESYNNPLLVIVCLLLVNFKTYINAPKKCMLFYKARQIQGVYTLNGFRLIDKVIKIQLFFPKKQN